MAQRVLFALVLAVAFGGIVYCATLGFLHR
jgi:hypothetical protein